MEDTESTKLFNTSIDVGNGEMRRVGEAVTPATLLSGSLPPVKEMHTINRHCMLGSMQRVAHSNNSSAPLIAVAGLKGHIPAAELQGRLAVAILNLKPAKLAGMASEAMLLAADSPKEDNSKLVRVLRPPGVCCVLWSSPWKHCRG